MDDAESFSGSTSKSFASYPRLKNNERENQRVEWWQKFWFERNNLKRPPVIEQHVESVTVPYAFEKPPASERPLQTDGNSNKAALWSFALSGVFVLLWSSGWIGAKFGLGYSGPFTFLTIRYLLVVIVLSLIIAVLSTFTTLSRISMPELIDHALVGLLSHGVYLAGSFAAMSYGASAGLVAFLSAMQPLFTTVCAGWILHEVGERASRLQWLGIVLGVVAMYFTLAGDIQGGGSSIPYVLLLLSVVAISIATLVDRRATLRRKKLGLRPSHLVQILWIHSASALLFFTVFGWSLEGFETSWNTEYVLTLTYMAGVVSIASYGLMYLLLRRMSAVNVSSLIYLTPPATMLMAWQILGESVTLGGVLGLAVGGVAVTVVLTTGNNKRKSVR